LHDETAMIEQQRSQAGKFFAASGPSGTAVQTTGHHIAVAGVLIANR